MLVLSQKMIYCPNNVPGDSIDRYFVNKDVGDVDTLEEKMDKGNHL